MTIELPAIIDEGECLADLLPRPMSPNRATRFQVGKSVCGERRECSQSCGGLLIRGADPDLQSPVHGRPGGLGTGAWLVSAGCRD